MLECILNISRSPATFISVSNRPRSRYSSFILSSASFRIPLYSITMSCNTFFSIVNASLVLSYTTCFSCDFSSIVFIIPSRTSVFLSIAMFLVSKFNFVEGFAVIWLRRLMGYARFYVSRFLLSRGAPRLYNVEDFWG